jgi:hypothetical protein
MSRYAKAIIGFVVTSLGGVGTWSGTALSDGHVTTGEWWQLLGIVLTVAATTFGVYMVPNAPPVQ